MRSGKGEEHHKEDSELRYLTGGQGGWVGLETRTNKFDLPYSCNRTTSEVYVRLRNALNSVLSAYNTIVTCTFGHGSHKHSLLNRQGTGQHLPRWSPTRL